MQQVSPPGKCLLFLDGDQRADAAFLALDQEYSSAVLQGLKAARRQARM